MTAQNQSSRPLALILGGSTGIGRAIALRLAQSGYDLVLVARNPSRLDSIKAELIQSTDTTVTTIASDLADFAQVEALQSQLAADDRHISKLVNAAGLFSRFGKLHLPGQRRRFGHGWTRRAPFSRDRI